MVRSSSVTWHLFNNFYCNNVMISGGFQCRCPIKDWTTSIQRDRNPQVSRDNDGHTKPVRQERGLGRGWGRLPGSLREAAFSVQQLEKVRFINMQINATGGMRGANTDLLSPALLQLTDGSLTPGISSANSSPTTKSPHPSSEKLTITDYFSYFKDYT